MIIHISSCVSIGCSQKNLCDDQFPRESIPLPLIWMEVTTTPIIRLQMMPIAVGKKWFALKLGERWSSKP
jgi:hypothetical protein